MKHTRLIFLHCSNILLNGVGALSLSPFIPPQSLCGRPRNIPRETRGSGQKLGRWCREVVLDCALFDQERCVIVCCAAVESRERESVWKSAI